MDEQNKSEEKKLTPEQLAEAEEIAETEEYLIRKKARASAVDDGDGAHGGGLGASGSAVDFGRPKNYSGIDDTGL